MQKQSGSLFQKLSRHNKNIHTPPPPPHTHKHTHIHTLYELQRNQEIDESKNEKKNDNSLYSLSKGRIMYQRS